MIGLGTLSAFEDVQALIKGKVGEFLAAEQTIRKHMQNPSVTIRGKAAGLLGAHQALEIELGGAQAKIAQFQTGAWSFSDVITLGDVGTRLLQHLSSVASLEREAGGVVSAGLLPTSMAPILGVSAAVGLLAYLILRK